MPLEIAFVTFSTINEYNLGIVKPSVSKCQLAKEPNFEYHKFS